MGNSKEGTVWSLEAGKLASASTKLWNSLGSRGASVVTQLDTDESFRCRIAEFMLRGGVSESTSQKIARFLLGPNMVGGIEEWTAFHGVRFTKNQLKSAEKFPWSEDVLSAPCPFIKGKTIKETHVAFLGLEKISGTQSTIVGFQKLYPAGVHPRFYSYVPDSWYTDEKFATEITLKFRWYLMLENIVPNSDSKTYVDQKAMLPTEYESPTAVENVAKDLLIAKKKGKFPNLSCYGMCDSVSLGGDRVGIGGGSSGRLFINNWRVDNPRSNVGVSASRKLPS